MNVNANKSHQSWILSQHPPDTVELEMGMGIEKANGKWGGWVCLSVSVAVYLEYITTTYINLPTKDLLILFVCYLSSSSATVSFIRKV